MFPVETKNVFPNVSMETFMPYLDVSIETCTHISDCFGRNVFHPFGPKLIIIDV